MTDTWKYPKDRYDVSVDWVGQYIFPTGATALTTLVVTVKDSVGADVTGTLLVLSGTAAFLSWAEIQSGTIGEIYSVRFRQTFDNGKVLDKYVTLEIRNPWTQALPQIFKYPNDAFDVPVSWTGRFPLRATALDTLTVKAYAAGDIDETSTYVEGWEAIGSEAAGYYSVAKIIGGVGGEVRLLEFAQLFDNGRLFHDYAMLTVRVPPA